MKTTWNSHRLLSIALLAAVAAPSIGCKSTSWKMPGSSFFSSSREPDASLLAGGNGMAELPDSPAAKYEPNTVASVGAQAPNSSSMASSSATVSGIPGATSVYGTSAQAVDTPRAGLAAQANGYQTGPYQVRPTTSTPANNPLTAGLPNPYGGSYAGAGSDAPDITLPTSVANAWSTESAASPSQYPGSPTSTNPYMGNQYTGTQGATANATTVANSKTAPISSASFPSYPTAPGASASLPNGTLGLSGSAAGSTGGYGTSGAATSMPALPNLAGAGNAPANGPQSSFTLPAGNMPGAGSSPSAPVPSAYKGATTLSGYSPGTTSRSTGYDFGNGPAASTSAPYPTSPSLTLPPNTANGSNPLLR